MWRGMRQLVGVFGLSALAWGQAPLSVPPEVGVASNALGDDLLRLFGKDARDASGNLIFSPLSISCAFAMLDAGARGETKAEIEQTLHFPADSVGLHEGYARLADSLNVWTDSAKLRLVNALFPQQGYPILPEYRELLAIRYRAAATELDFVRNAEGAANVINDWISRQTEQRIRKVIDPGTFDPNTRFVLVNAVYFKYLWTSQFDESATIPMPFRPLAGDVYLARTMRQQGYFAYCENALVQVLELPYVGGRYSMVIALPKQLRGLPEVTKRFCDSTLVNLRNLSPALVDVSLPKFVIDGATVDLVPYLQQLGMRHVFMPQSADLGGVSRERPLWVNVALHKGWIEVNEQGTEAAAATVIGGTIGGMEPAEPRPVVFRADHPFLFVIRDRVTGSALFIGQLAAPPMAE